MVIIVGGGITGLSAAYELSRRQVPFVVLEGAARPGGLIFTEQVDGFTLDAGPDSILAQKPAAIRLCEELGLGGELLHTTPPRLAYVLRRGRLHALPSPSVLGIPLTLRALARYDLLSPAARARIALEPVIPRAPRQDESVAAFFRRRFGPQTVGLVAEPLLGGIHAGDIESLSMPALFPRLVEAEQAPRKVLRTLRRSVPTGGDGLFRSLPRGMGQLVTELASALPERSIRLNAPASALVRCGEEWEVAAGGETHRGLAVILAVPAHAAGELLAPLDARAAALCREVPYASTASVALGFRRDAVAHGLRGSGFVVARRHNDLRITACTWVSSKWRGRAPDGHALLRVFVGGVHDPGAVDLDDDSLVAVAMRDLSSVLPVKAPPILARAYRWRHAGAQHNVGQQARVAELRRRLAALPGLLVAGSGFESVGIPDCVAHGRAAAERAAGRW